jgi:hypothetical protein
MTTATATADAAAILAGPWTRLRDRHRRHEGHRALVGGLLRAGVSAEDVTVLVGRLCELTADDEADKRLQLVDDTAARLAADQTVEGWPSLIKLLGDGGEAIVRDVQQALGIGGRRVVAEYPYEDEAGVLRFQTVRFEPKDFRQRRPDGKGDWIWDLKGIERLLYRLPELVSADPSAIVYLPEGEKDVDALRALGLVATCNPMGAGKWQSRFKGPLRNRHVVILADNDDKGRDHARQVARGLSGVAASVKLLELPGLPQAGDVSDWLAAGGTAEDLARLVEAAPPWQDGVPAQPTPPPILPVDPPWPDPLADEAFHGLAGDVVRVLEPASEADPAALLFQGLVAFGNQVGRGPHFRVEADTHYTNEYVVLVGRTSKGRKGVSWGQSLRPLAPADATWATDRIQGGLSSGEGLIAAVCDPVTTRQPVKEKGRVVDYEDVVTNPGVADKRLLVLETEFANVLKQTERQGNTLSVIVRHAWDTGNLRTLTKNNPVHATGAHVSIVGHITDDELRRYLSVTETANGFANRFLWVCARRSKVLPEGGEPDAQALADVQTRLAEAVAFARRVGEMRRDEGGRAIWREIYGELSEGRPGLSGALLSRAEAHVMRLGLLYALLDCSAAISAEHLLAALALWQYVEQSVRHVFGDRLGDPAADELLRLLRGCPDGMTRNAMMDYFGRNLSSDRIGRALGLLLQHRLARCERQETGGRPAERWFAASGAVGR